MARVLQMEFDADEFQMEHVTAAAARATCVTNFPGRADAIDNDGNS
jgi:hypothetical protein